jgi:predicted RNA polymerase sigma factor
VTDEIDHTWIELVVKAARPQAVGALLRYFRDLDIAEEAFQEACLRALTNWPHKGRPARPSRVADLGRSQPSDRRPPAEEDHGRTA